MFRVLAACLALVVLGCFGASAQERALPDRDALFTATEQNLVKSEREEVHYAYRERRTDLHTNPFGKIGTDGTRVYDVTPGSPPGVFYRTLIERNGKPVTGSKPEKEEPPQRRERSNKRGPLEEALDMLDFMVERRDVIDGRDMIVVGFAPKPDAKADSDTQKMAKKFKGEVWIDESACEVARVEAVAIDDLTFGLGLLARLHEGTRATLVREPVDSTVWLPTSLRFKGEGHAMLFRKLVVDYAVDWFDYRRVN